MKRHFYHVSYYSKSKKTDNVGDCIIDAPEPITTVEGIDAMRELIAQDEETTVVILGFTLLRIEDTEPKDVTAT
jgi:hypothetical protein